MIKRILILAVVLGATFCVSSPTAEAGGPIFRPSGPRLDIPQPFSTRRGRELEAARFQRRSGVVYSNQPSFYGSVYRPQVNRSFVQQSRVTSVSNRRFPIFRRMGGR